MLSGLDAAVLDAFPAHVAIVDDRGIIIRVNRAWTDFARANGDARGEATGIGADYLAACGAPGTIGGAPTVAAGVRAVLDGAAAEFECEYPCHGPHEERWFMLRAVPLRLGAWRGAVLSHTNVTSTHQSGETARHEARVSELRALELVAGEPSTRSTEQSFGLGPLQRAAPAQFAEFVEREATLLEQAVEMRGYRVDYRLSDALRDLAGDLAFLRAQPRDIVDVHVAALRQVVAAAPPSRAEAIHQEARLLVLEMMGHLATHYRLLAGGVRAVRAR